MSANPSAIDAATIERTKNQIRGLVNEIAQLSKSDLGPEQFYGEFLQRVVQALAAVGGAVWIAGDGGQLNLTYQINLPEPLLDRDGEDAQRHQRLLLALIRSGEPKLIPPLASAGEDGRVGNPTRNLLVLHPLRGGQGQDVEGMVEVFQRPDGQPATQRGYLKFLQQMCEFASDWLKTQKIMNYSDRQSLWAQADLFARMAHESLDPRRTAYTIANEARRMLGCDRVSVAVRKGRKCEILAISGQDTIESRSNIVRTLADLATRVCATEEPLWYTGVTEDLPPQVERALEAYVEESFARSVTVLPLHKPAPEQEAGEARVGAEPDEAPQGEVIGALIIEQIESSLPRMALQHKADLIYEHSSRAMANAVTHNNLFLMPVWRTLGKASWVVKGRTLPKTLAVAAAVLACILALCLVPYEFAMKAKGSLQPKVRRDVFVDVDGVVIELKKDHDDDVRKGETLAILQNTDLDVELTDVRGRWQTVNAQLTAVNRRLLSDRGSLSAEERSERSRLASERMQLQEQLASLKMQEDLLKRKRAQLEIKSPISGKVITADLEERLMLRPVTRGEMLLTVADPTQDWELELLMPDKRMGHIHEAQRSLKDGEKLKVTYRLASDPDVDREGIVSEIRTVASPHEEEGHSVVMLVDIDEKDAEHPLVNPHPGTTVTAKVACGYRPLGYVLLHDAWEWLQVNVFFHL